jgi:AbiU2
MSNHQSADDIRAESIAKMGEEFGAIRDDLRNQVGLLHIRWQEYRRLFAASPEIILLLNKTAPAFFYEVERVMWENVIVQLCRITESPQMGVHEHLTIQRFPSMISELTVRQEVQVLVDAVVAKTKFARDWRNRKLAHMELPPPSGEVAVPLADASRRQIEDALSSVRDVMNYLEKHYLGCPVSYEHAIEPVGGVASLLAVLREGLEARTQYLRSHGVDMP